MWKGSIAWPWYGCAESLMHFVYGNELQILSKFSQLELNSTDINSYLLHGFGAAGSLHVLTCNPYSNLTRYMGEFF